MDDEQIESPDRPSEAASNDQPGVADVAQLKQERDEFYDRLLRKTAEFEDVGTDHDVPFNLVCVNAPELPRFYAEVAVFRPEMAVLERTVNGRPGLVVQRDGVTEAVIAFDVVGDRVRHIWSVRNPEKLRPWKTL